MNQKSSLREDPQFVSRTLTANNQHFIDRFIKVKTLPLGRHFLDVITNPVNDISGSIGIEHYALKRLFHFTQIRGLKI